MTSISTKRFVVPFKVAIEFESGLTVEDIDADHAEAMAQAVIQGLRLVSDDGAGNTMSLEGELSITESVILEAAEIDESGDVRDPTLSQTSGAARDAQERN